LKDAAATQMYGSCLTRAVAHARANDQR
jgi:hypothetical protein